MHILNYLKLYLYIHIYGKHQSISFLLILRYLIISREVFTYHEFLVHWFKYIYIYIWSIPLNSAMYFATEQNSTWGGSQAEYNTMKWIPMISIYKIKYILFLFLNSLNMFFTCIHFMLINLWKGSLCGVSRVLAIFNVKNLKIRWFHTYITTRRNKIRDRN